MREGRISLEDFKPLFEKEREGRFWAYGAGIMWRIPGTAH
jgi:hypothetical protein